MGAGPSETPLRSGSDFCFWRSAGQAPPSPVRPSFPEGQRIFQISRRRIARRAAAFAENAASAARRQHPVFPADIDRAGVAEEGSGQQGCDLSDLFGVGGRARAVPVKQRVLQPDANVHSDREPSIDDSPVGASIAMPKTRAA